MANTIDDSIREAVEGDYPDEGAVVSSWIVTTSVELPSGETSYGVYASNGLRQHEAHGLLYMAVETLP